MNQITKHEVVVMWDYWRKMLPDLRDGTIMEMVADYAHLEVGEVADILYRMRNKPTSPDEHTSHAQL